MGEGRKSNAKQRQCLPHQRWSEIRKKYSWILLTTKTTGGRTMSEKKEVLFATLYSVKRVFATAQGRAATT